MLVKDLSLPFELFLSPPSFLEFSEDSSADNVGNMFPSGKVVLESNMWSLLWFSTVVETVFVGICGLSLVEYVVYVTVDADVTVDAEELLVSASDENGTFIMIMIGKYLIHHNMYV